MRPILQRIIGASALFLPKSTCLWSSAACRSYCDALPLQDDGAEYALSALLAAADLGRSSVLWHATIQRMIADVIVGQTGTALFCSIGDITRPLMALMSETLDEMHRGGISVIGFSRNIEWVELVKYNRTGRIYYSLDPGMEPLGQGIPSSIAHPEDCTIKLSTDEPYIQSCSTLTRQVLQTCDKCKANATGCFHE